MSVPNQTPYIIYNANGLTTVFPFEFYIINSGDIQVTINGTVITSGYTVSGVGNIGGGDVIIITPPASGSVVMLERVVPTYRLTDYQDNGDLLADTVNKDFDRLWMAIQRYGIHLGLALRRPLFGGPFDAEGYRIEKLADPVNAQDAVTKKYLESISLSRVLRVPEESVGLVPSLGLRRNKLLAFNNSGDPIPVLPESGSASDVLIELAKPTGSSLIGYKYPVDGSVQRTVQDKLDDFVFLEDFGGKVNDINVDNSIAFTKAFAASPNVRLKYPGIYYMKTREVVLPPNWNIEGLGFNTELKYPGTDTTFVMFTANGTGPEDFEQVRGGVFRNLTIAADVSLTSAFLFRHLKHALWDRCFFYNAGTIMDNFHYIDYIFCQRWGSPFYGAATTNTYNHLSEMPRWLNCFSSNSPIDLIDTTDAVLSNSIFYNGEFVVRQRYTAPGLLPGDKTYGFPIHINHCVMDAVRGAALDLDRLAYFNITGNLISAGRYLENDGVVITNSVSGTFSDNVITFSDAFGQRAYNLYQCNFGGNILNGNKAGGISLSNSKQCTISGGAMGTSYSYGGYYVRPVCFTDPANSCTDITLMGIQFDDDLTVKLNLNTNPPTNNRILACRGTPDTFYSGPTSARPSPVGMGFTYFDTTLGLQIQWNGTTGSWQRSDGTNV
ncbi:phage tail fiber protein [Enterobacter hormaechei]|uniref:phage tail fiber domain-containing protein n=1 Tax=Enterobacter hormaechei TaxID=158836 RepID=UPI000CFA5F5A|nr:phage tail fiber protein [Enterobacter hormaechei]AVJ78552.1 phage T7 tail fiber family protein [Enterobacter hormaechei subsp. hoffmannii]EKU3265379.1 hypothetical protein [Enterobacter hormaechei]EKU3268000.1 hypothetical protein [Enterobacter hormaechei]EKU3270673.1 hypothetical protein [Enterobacter hormaechei]EKW3905390.1 hypothetical protein [Enterobacter hormaechei]